MSSNGEETKYIFSGGECATCASLAGEHLYPVGKQHPNCGCTTTIQRTRVECVLEAMVEDRNEISTDYMDPVFLDSGEVEVWYETTWDVVTTIITRCVRVDAATGQPRGEPFYEQDIIHRTDTTFGTKTLTEDEWIEHGKPDLVPPP